MIKIEGYQALSDLIYKGFLLTGLSIGKDFFVFKTVNDREQRLIKVYSGQEDRAYVNRYNLNYLIFSLFLVNGENVLLKREETYQELWNLFYNLPNILVRDILAELTKMRNSALEAVEFLEGFSYTDRSRRMWRSLANSFPSREEFTGIPGTSKMGLNVFQENWMLVNRMLDDEDRHNQEFSTAIFVASASNPKGVRSVRSKFDSNIQLTEKRRKKLAKLGSQKKQEWTPERWSAPVDTAEELVAELMRQMEGKKDKHDLFIDKHIEKIRKRTEEKTEQIKKKLEEARNRRPEDILALSVAQRPLSPEEAEELKARKPNNLVIINDMKSEKQKEEDRIYSKIGSKVLTGRK